ncbi:MAG TPA: hypothetical protein VHM91_15985 [Verrucomicrobiales bacterium]|jgi:hypothetical protein|nr:hypothetical protein [Verrucomicrobiales bacterium]
MNPESDPAALSSLQAQIYRRKIVRAREMTETERLDEALELTKGAYEWMHEGVMAEFRFTDPEEGWSEVTRRLQRLRKVHEHGLYSPVAAL